MLLSKINPHLAATVTTNHEFFLPFIPSGAVSVHCKQVSLSVQFLEAALTGKRAKVKYMGLNKEYQQVQVVRSSKKNASNNTNQVP